MHETEIRNYIDNDGNKIPSELRLPRLTTDTHISVVIPAYNEKGYILNLLKHLDIQKIDKEFEIVVVDNGSTDNTTKVVHSSKLKHSTYTIQENSKGAGNARKTGVDEIARRLLERDIKKDISKHFIIFTDADTQPDQNWISDIYDQLTSTDESILLSGNYFASEAIDEKVYKATGIRNYFKSFALLSGLLDKYVGQTRMRGPNSALEIECYIKVSGFRQPMDINGNTVPHECFDLADRIASVGLPVQHLDHPIIASQRRKLFEIISGISEGEEVQKVDYWNLNVK